MPDPDDWTASILYRLAEARGDMRSGRDAASRAAGGTAAAILAEVLRMVGDDDPETVREAVGDALEGRKPRW